MSNLTGSSSPRPYATFRGELNAARATQLYRSRSFSNRCLAIVIIMAVITVVCAGMWWFLSRRADPSHFDRIAVGGGWLLGFCFAVRSQSASYLGRTWQQNNAPLCGSCELALFEEHLDIRSRTLGQRISYRGLRPRGVGVGRTYVSISLDFFDARMILLPVEDCDPSLTAPEIKSFLQSRIRTVQSETTEIPSVVTSDHPPLPFGLAKGRETIEIAGALLAAAAQEVLATEQHKQSQPNRIDRAMPWFMLVMGILLLGLVITGRVIDRHVPQGLAYLSITLVGISITMLRRARKKPRKPRVTADPTASLAEIKGWISPEGFSVVTEHGSLAAPWNGCESVEVVPTQITIKVWRGQFFLFGRHIFQSKDDWTRAVEWIRSVRTA